MSDLAFLPAHALAGLLRRRECSAVELLDLYLARLDRLDGSFNAVPVRDPQRARQRALAADEATARGQSWGPLHGVPMTVKESFNVAGLPTTYGFEAFRGNLAQHDAVTVARLKSAGAVIFGKTNVPVSLADWQTFNPVYGTTHNPWDLTRTPGGSSGGAAAALAAGLTALELGSDIGASIRNPAHYCGVWGHKPTWGVVPLTGHELLPRADADHFDIAVAGPMARSASDLVLAMEVLAAPLDLWTPIGRLPAVWRPSRPEPRDCRVAVMYDDAQAEVDQSVQHALRELVEFLRKQGVQVRDDVSPVDGREARLVYLHLLRAATGSRYDDPVYSSALARAAGYGAEEDHYAACHFRGSTLSHRDWVAFDERRALLRQQWAAFFQQYDLLICPVATTAAFVQDQTGERWERMIPVNGRMQPGTDSLFWAGYPGIVGLPATAVPIGQSDAGLPIGAQIVAPWLADPSGLRFAVWLEQAYRGFVPPPLARSLA